MVDTIMTANTVSPVYSSQKRKNKKKRQKKFAGRLRKQRDDNKEKRQNQNKNKNVVFGLTAPPMQWDGAENKTLFKICRKGNFRIPRYMKKQIDLMA